MRANTPAKRAMLQRQREIGRQHKQPISTEETAEFRGFGNDVRRMQAASGVRRGGRMVRYSDGINKDGTPKIVRNYADVPSGAFMNPNSTSSYLQPGAYARAVNLPAETSEIPFRFGSPEPEPTRAVETIKEHSCHGTHTFRCAECDPANN